jgi:prepilin-type processing-associated H-X9-DG protein
MNFKTICLPSEQALSRPDLLATLVALLLLATAALPLLSANKSRSEQAICSNNLRRVGRAVHLWGTDHGDRTPWFTPAAEGGTRGTVNPLKNNAYFQIGTMSNELASPEILVCPSDLGVGLPRKMATDFSATNLNGGFFALGFRNSAVSYLAGLHSLFEAPQSILSGDRNIRWDSENNFCSLGIGSAPTLFVANSSAQWTNAIHIGSGNVLYSDGHVDQLSTLGLQKAVGDPRQGSSGGESDHFLAP